MRILSFYGDLDGDRHHGERLRDASANETTIIDLSRVTYLGEAFAHDLFRFLHRSMKGKTGAIVVAQGNIARKLRSYGVGLLVRIIDEHDLAKESTAA